MFLKRFINVKGCLKFFDAVFSVFFAWEKSMGSGWVFLIVCSPANGHYILVNVDGVESDD